MEGFPVPGFFFFFFFVTDMNDDRVGKMWYFSWRYLPIGTINKRIKIIVGGVLGKYNKVCT